MLNPESQDSFAFFDSSKLSLFQSWKCSAMGGANSSEAVAQHPPALWRAARSPGAWDAEEQGSDPVGGYSLILQFFLSSEGGVGTWAHSAGMEQLPRVE